MKTRRTFLNMAGAAALATAGFTAQAQAQETLNLHQMLPPQAAVPSQILEPWMAKVAEESNGTLSIKHFPSMQLGGTPPELMDQAKDGVADIVWTVIGYTPGRFPRTEVFELPFMATNAEATSMAFWDMFETHMKDTEFADLHIIGTWVHGPGLFHTKDAVEVPEDLEGMKIRGGSRLVTQLLEKLGATPVGMPVPAVSEALSKGVIDGTTIPWEVTTAVKSSELVTNHTEFTGNALYVLGFVLAMNKDKYESLPDDAKAALDANSGAEFSAWAGKMMDELDAPGLKIAEDLGNNIITIDAEGTEEWKELSEPIYAEWIADMESKGIDGQALIDEARAKIAEYTK
ncbi:TRAP transporter substrate-binding protein [Vannielia litorea]|uniref:TRAP transporter substrate-binding protein n=1 Tax=Vannielia litorea TaxID=1217970 RepID=UPI001C93EB74|nr:TRAP transporter substrate-binding protein [Vannielia litorea]MBY6049842.1 TRAP transporter substrate-binding protein [Vannielia litorea]MBY6077256.1 TRAP transporter substrate-binding protein [Vannielia litorea]